jgi:uncharacterized DUF497 family protein
MEETRAWSRILGAPEMISEQYDKLVGRIKRFGWNERKREKNFQNHKIDFLDARLVFDNPSFVHRSDRRGQIRYQVFGYLDGREIAVACTIEDDLCWIISARPASRKERRRYYDRVTG